MCSLVKPSVGINLASGSLLCSELKGERLDCFRCFSHELFVGLLEQSFQIALSYQFSLAYALAFPSMRKPVSSVFRGSQLEGIELAD